MSKKEVVAGLLPTIRRLLNDGHRLDHISELLKKRGFSIHYKTLEKYLREADRALAAGDAPRAKSSRQGARARVRAAPEPTPPARGPRKLQDPSRRAGRGMRLLDAHAQLASRGQS